MVWNSTGNSLINPNHIRAYGLSINNDPFNANELGIAAEELFIPFDTTGTVVHFESRVLTERETTHLPVILITADSWDPTTFYMSAGKRILEDVDMRTICSLKSSTSKRAISAMLRDQINSRKDRFVQVEQEPIKTATVFDERTLCRRLIGAVNIATTSVMILMVGQRSAECISLSLMTGIRRLDQRSCQGNGILDCRLRRIHLQQQHSMAYVL